MVGDRFPPGEFWLADITTQQAPISADRAFKVTLPRLVESFDEINPIILGPRPRHYLLEDMSLVRRRRQSALTHSSSARPTHLPDQNFFAWKNGRDAAVNGVHMGGRNVGGNWKVFPIRQDVDGDEIDRRGEIAVAQPEFPDIRVGYRHSGPGFDLPQNCRDIFRRELPAQQHLVADNDPYDHIRIALGERNRRVDLDAVLLPVATEPQALQHLETQALGSRRYLVEPIVGRIGAHAPGKPGEL